MTLTSDVTAGSLYAPNMNRCLFTSGDHSNADFHRLGTSHRVVATFKLVLAFDKWPEQEQRARKPDGQRTRVFAGHKPSLGQTRTHVTQFSSFLNEDVCWMLQRF